MNLADHIKADAILGRLSRSKLAQVNRDPVGKLQALLRSRPFGLPAVSSDPPVVTYAGPNLGGNIQATTITNGVLVRAENILAGTDKRFSLVSPDTFRLLATSNEGVKFYDSDVLATNIPIRVVAFYFDGAVVEICGRSAEKWQILVDDEYVDDEALSTPPGGTFGLSRTVLTFATRRRRKFICYGEVTGIWGIGIGPTDTLEPLDFSSEISAGFMADSYGTASSPLFTGGPFWTAFQHLGVRLITSSVTGGTGYVTGTNFMTRISDITNKQPEIFLSAGGINDDPGAMVDSDNAALKAYFGAARNALPSALLIATGPWAPNDAHRTVGQYRRDAISAGLDSVAGPSIMIDNIDGVWWAKSTDGTVTNGLAGNAFWQTGTGSDAAPTGSGNADHYLGADKVHPNVAGVDFLAKSIASAIKDAALSMNP